MEMLFMTSSLNHFQIELDQCRTSNRGKLYQGVALEYLPQRRWMR